MSIHSLATHFFQSTIAVSILIALILLIRRPFARAFGAKAAYTLWTIPVLRVILPPMPSEWTLLGWLQTEPKAPETVTTFVSEGASVAPFAPTLSVPPVTPFEPGSVALPTNEQDAFSFASIFETATPHLFTFWLIGMLAVLMLSLLRQRSAASLIHSESHTPSQSIVTLARQVQHMLAIKPNTVEVKASLISSGPLVTGLTKPIVLLPEWFETDYTAAERKFALTHEMMHIKRGDLWTLYVATIFIALQWFNPLAWLALKAFRTDQEAACDADVLALRNTCPHGYGATLVKAARISRPVAQPVQAASLPLNHALQERLHNMKHPLPTAKKRLTGLLLTASVGVAALFASACAASSAQTAELAGGDEASETKVEVRSVFISDDASDSGKIKIIKNGKIILLEDLENVEGLKELESLEGLAALTILEALGGEENKKAVRLMFKGDSEFPDFEDHDFIFLGDHTGNPRPDASKFAAKMRELAQEPTKNQAEIKALAEDFEQRMEDWSGAHSNVLPHTRFSLTDEFITSTDIDGDHECGDEPLTRTVIINRDDEAGHEEKSITTNCGTPSIDTSNIIADLRARGDISEERLAEIKAKLEEAEARVEATKSELGKMQFKFDIDTDESDE